MVIGFWILTFFVGLFLGYVIGFGFAVGSSAEDKMEAYHAGLERGRAEILADNAKSEEIAAKEQKQYRCMKCGNYELQGMALCDDCELQTQLN